MIPPRFASYDAIVVGAGVAVSTSRGELEGLRPFAGLIAGDVGYRECLRKAFLAAPT